MGWTAREHSDDENIRWSWLRAVEWGRWPIFLSRTFAPVLLIPFGWLTVVAGVFVANLVWALFVRYRTVSVSCAYWGVNIILLSWLAWPVSTVWLFVHGRSPEEWIALLWPALIFPLGFFTPTQTGRIQKMLLERLGYSGLTDSHR